MMTPPRVQRITVEVLKAHFREAVALLSAFTAPLPYRNHVFALVLIKHLNDVFNEHCEKILQTALKQGKSREEAEAMATDADEHRFFVPPKAQWSDLLNAEDRLGARLELACLELERHNPIPLRGVLTALRFEHADSPEGYDTLWRKLLLHLDKLPLGYENFISPEILGEASTFLFSHLAMQSAKRADAQTSSHELMLLLAELLRPEAGMRICDPACGAGGALIACTGHLRARGGNPQNLSLFGQEYDAATRALCVMNLLLHDLTDAHIALGSTISNPMLDETGGLMQFDLVISEPPFSLREWEYEIAAQVSLGRFDAGLPPPRHGELAFVQHMAATLNAKGRAAVIVPQGVLFRGGSEKHIRADLLRADLIETVIALPEGALPGQKAAAAVLILNRAKHARHRGHVLFIDAARARSFSAFVLDETERRKIVALYTAWREQQTLVQTLEKLSAEFPDRDHTALKLQEWAVNRPVERATTIVDFETIAAQNDFNLSVGRYVAGADDYEVWNVRDLLVSLPELERQALTATEEMKLLLREFGHRFE